MAGHQNPPRFPQPQVAQACFASSDPFRFNVPKRGDFHDPPQLSSFWIMKNFYQWQADLVDGFQVFKWRFPRKMSRWIVWMAYVAYSPGMSRQTASSRCNTVRKVLVYLDKLYMLQHQDCMRLIWESSVLHVTYTFARQVLMIVVSICVCCSQGALSW